ncbi:MAG: pyridine nucleotide-disulfide oxidoreductase, partial [Casimicrobiaceae bacterium]
MLNSAFALTFADLYTSGGAARVDAAFVAGLREADAVLVERLAAARAAPAELSRKDESTLLIDVAPYVEDFLAQLFDIGPEVRALQARHHALAPLFAVKRQFVQRKAMNAYKADAAAAIDGPALRTTLDAMLGAPVGVKAFELAFAEAVSVWQRDDAAHTTELDVAARYAAWSAHTSAGKALHKGGTLFRAPRKLDMLKLVPIAPVDLNGLRALRLADDHPLRRREGFALTDRG